MASNQIGNCSLTPGSALVTFDSDAIMTNMAAGDLFRVRSDLAFYTIASVDASNYTCTLTSRYSNSDYILTILDEVADTSDGTNVFSVTLENTYIIPGTASFADGSSVETFTDNGDGTLTGDQDGTGTISYEEGTVELTFNSEVPDGVEILASYNYGVTLSQTPFQIVRDYTPYFEWPEPYSTDQNPQTITRHALRMIDNDLRNNAAQVFSISVFDSDTSVTDGSGNKAFTIPYFMDGYLFTDAIASVHTKGVTGATSVQIRRRRAGADTDLLSPVITIGDEYYARDGTAITDEQAVAVGDQLYVDITGVHTTAPKGLSVSIILNKS
jgi:hypothetical protein